MNGSFESLDIILFALLAAFLVYRLGSVLGKRTGHERPGNEGFGPLGGSEGKSADSGNDNVVTLPHGDAVTPEREKEPDTPIGAAITQIMVADRNFTRDSFLDGARAAFEMVITAFALGDLKTLRSLLSNDVYDNFAGAIRSREQNSQTIETTLVGIDAAEIIEADVQNNTALVTVKFVSQQVNATRDESGEVIDGDPSAVDKVTDIWSFERRLGGSDPNWTLVATRSPS
ncbi:MAG: Tim44/TimA family putative adaptor protein [Alphaproteobacteria bacterium]|nr:Tim44/TimA family putative adaptor protein [Alphaproteobacteria bacterium]